MPEEKKKTKYTSYLVRFGVAAIALYFAFRGESIGKIGSVLLKLNWWIFAAALGIYIVSNLIFVARWYMLLWVQGIRIGYWPSVRLHFLGLFYNNCLPSSVGGDLLRAWYVTKHTDKKLEAALSVFVDRAIGLTGTILMAITGYWFIPAEERSLGLGLTAVGNSSNVLAEHKWTIFIVTGIFAAFVAGFGMTGKGRSLIRKWLIYIEEHGLMVLQKVHEAVRIYYHHKLALLAAFLLTFVCQGIFIVAMWLVGRDIGIDAHFKYYCIFFPLSWVIGSLPISVGGAGVMEWWLKDIFVRVCSVPGELALVLALCQRLLWIFGSSPGVVIHLAGAHLPEQGKDSKAGLSQAGEFFIDCKRPSN